MTKYLISNMININQKMNRVLFTIIYMVAINQVVGQTTIKMTNQILGKAKGYGINANYSQTPFWNRSQLLLNKIPYGVFEHPIDAKSGDPYEDLNWEYSGGAASSDKATPYQGLQALKFASNGNNGLITNKGIYNLYLDPNQNYILTFAAKKANDFTGKVNARIHDHFFGQEFYVSPEISLTSDWKVYSYTFKPSKEGDYYFAFDFNVKGAGTIYLDDFKLYKEKDFRGDNFAKTAVDLLKDFQPDVLRWGSLPANFLSFKNCVGKGVADRVSMGEWMKLAQELNAGVTLCTGTNYKTDYIDQRDKTFTTFAEYIAGSNTTAGGAIRASEGFKDNFLGLKQINIELGCEIWGGATHGAAFYTLGGEIDPINYKYFADSAARAMLKVKPIADNRNKIFFSYSGHDLSWDSWNGQVLNRNYKLVGDNISPSGYFGGNLALPNGVEISDPTSIDEQRKYYRESTALIFKSLAAAKSIKTAAAKSQGKEMSNFLYEGNMVTEKYYGKLGQALIYTDFINEMYKANLLFEVDVFTLHQGFWAIVDYVKGEPVKKPLFTIGSLFNQMCRGDLVKSSAFGKMDSVATSSGFTSFNKVGSSITTPDGKNFNLLLISRDFENDQNVSIDLPAGIFAKTAIIKTVSAPNWNVDVESNLNIKTENISNFATGSSFKVPKHSMVIVSFSGDLSLITGNETNDITLANDDFQVFPNPLTHQGVIDFQLSQPSEITLEIKDLTGIRVSTILNDYKSSGSYSVKINSENLASGMYMCTLTTSHKVVTKKIIIQK